MAVTIQESDMLFGEYKDEQVFQIEKSIQYNGKLKSNGVKVCEFILLRGNKLYFIEAKKSCPNQIVGSSSEEKKVNYNKYINDIILKMRHSLALYSNILLKRYTAEDVPELIYKKSLSNLEIRLVLVVKNAEKEWLTPFQDVFKKELQAELRIWKIPSFSVINEAVAREKYFIK